MKETQDQLLLLPQNDSERVGQLYPAFLFYLTIFPGTDTVSAKSCSLAEKQERQ